MGYLGTDFYYFLEYFILATHYRSEAIKLISYINYCLSNYKDVSKGESTEKQSLWSEKLDELSQMSKRIDQLADRLDRLNQLELDIPLFTRVFFYFLSYLVSFLFVCFLTHF